jgi:carbohydrate-binding DOMON domain-containing protein
MPKGMMNIFATEWSNPSATNALIGNQTATIFPISEAQPDAMYTAMHTSQLQRMPRTKAVSKGREHLAVAIAALAGLFPRVPDLKARYARRSEPTKLPA